MELVAEWLDELGFWDKLDWSEIMDCWVETCYGALIQHLEHYICFNNFLNYLTDTYVEL